MLAAPAPAPTKTNGSAQAKAKETTYAGVYDAFGLLRENTILAHAVHLEEEEVEIIKARRAGVSHCPTSNFNLRSGCARIGMLLDRGVKVRPPLLFPLSPVLPQSRVQSSESTSY